MRNVSSLPWVAAWPVAGLSWRQSSIGRAQSSGCNARVTETFLATPTLSEPMLDQTLITSLLCTGRRVVRVRDGSPRLTPTSLGGRRQFGAWEIADIVVSRCSSVIPAAIALRKVAFHNPNVFTQLALCTKNWQPTIRSICAGLDDPEDEPVQFGTRRPCGSIPLLASTRNLPRTPLRSVLLMASEQQPTQGLLQSVQPLAIALRAPRSAYESMRHEGVPELGVQGASGYRRPSGTLSASAADLASDDCPHRPGLS